MDQVPDYYAILHLDQSCTQDEIREQYKRMVKVFHPDHHKGDVWCEQQLRLCNKAYEVLGDLDSRRVYDLRLSGLAPEPVFKFDAGQDRSDHDDDRSWTFNAPPQEEPQPAPDFVFESPAAPTASQSSTQFDSRTIDATWLMNKRPEGKKRMSRSSMILVGSTAFAALIAISIISLTQDPVSSHSSPVPQSTPTQLQQLQSAAAPDFEQSPAANAARVKKTSKDAGPFWTRYEMDQQFASRAITDAGQKLHGRNQDVLTSKSQALQQTSSEIQYKFDDLTYGSDNEASAKAEISEKLDSFEQEIRDIRALNTQKQKPAQIRLAAMHGLDSTAKAIATPSDSAQPMVRALPPTAAQASTEPTHTSSNPGTAAASPRG